MPQGLVIVAYVAATVILSLFAHMPVRDVVLLLGAAGGVGVVLTANAKGGKGGGGGRLLRRLLNASLNNSAGS